MTIALKLREETYAFLNTPGVERELTELEFRRQNKIGLKAWRSLKTDWQIEVRDKSRKEGDLQRAVGILDDVMASKDDKDLELIRKIKEMDDAVFEAGTIRKISKMAELWYKRKGLLIEKQEIKAEYTFNAADYIEIAREVLGRIAEIIPERCRGNCPLLTQTPLLPTGICVDREQEHSQDG